MRLFVAVRAFMATYFVYASHFISLTYPNDRSSRTHIIALSIFSSKLKSWQTLYMVRTSQVLELYSTPRHVGSGVGCDDKILG
jgi:hypothetical protein